MDSGKNLILWIALFSALLLGAAAEWFPRSDAAHRLDRLPLSGALFSSRELALTPAEISFFGPARVVKRLYSFQRDRFVLVAVDGSADRHAVHDPLYCLRGAGWQLRATKDVDIDGGRARLLRLSRKGVTREVLYWFSDGASRHASMTRYWLQTTLRRLTLGKSGPEPVLVMLQSTADDRPYWRALLNRCALLFEI
jgi:Protein of unknown function (DUF3485)